MRRLQRPRRRRKKKCRQIPEGCGDQDAATDKLARRPEPRGCRLKCRPGAPGRSGSRAAGKLAPGQKININKATEAELDTLPGIGPAKAQAILAFRTQNGAFKTIEDIQKVKGIKAAGFSKLKAHIKVAD